MTRDEFRAAVFFRDSHLCVMCGSPAEDAHHILDRKLFAHGGYDLNNGASLCGPCHVDAETTLLSVADVREAAGITTPVLPEGFDVNSDYDKWGNKLNPDETRERGPLFRDDGARKALHERGVLYDGTFGWEP